MNVLMLTCQYMPDVYGGAEKQCWRLSKALKRQGVNIKLITSLQNASATFQDDLPIARIYTRKAPDLLGRWIPYSIYWFLRVIAWGVVKRKSYDVIHCHQGKFGGFVGCFLGALVKKPVLIKIGNSEQDMDFLCLKRKFFFGPLFFRYLLRRQPYVVAISRVIAGNLEEAGFKNIICIPNGVDVSEIETLKANETQREVKDDKVVDLFYHGRVEKIKRVRLLVEALSELNNQNVHLHIVGDGEELNSVKQRVSELGLTERVTMYGRADNVLDRVSRWDIFVNASEAEGFSNSLLEALVLGKVMVSTNVSGAAEAIESGVNGVISDGCSPRELATAIDKAIVLHRCGMQKAKQESSKKIKEVFDIDLIASRYIQLYGELV